MSPRKIYVTFARCNKKGTSTKGYRSCLQGFIKRSGKEERGGRGEGRIGQLVSLEDTVKTGEAGQAPQEMI
jgi:hypothetical protein